MLFKPQQWHPLTPSNWDTKSPFKWSIEPTQEASTSVQTCCSQSCCLSRLSPNCQPRQFAKEMDFILSSMKIRLFQIGAFARVVVVRATLAQNWRCFVGCIQGRMCKTVTDQNMTFWQCHAGRRPLSISFSGFWCFRAKELKQSWN